MNNEQAIFLNKLWAKTQGHHLQFEMAARIKWVRDKTLIRAVSWNIVSFRSCHIDLQGDKAVVNMIWLTLGAELLTSPPKVTEYGTERAEMVKQDGRWLFKNRIILSEGGMPEASLETYPKEEK